MKRFYCTTCKRVKRVQKWPDVISQVDSIDPAMRVGECDKHSKPIIRAVRVKPTPITKSNTVSKTPVRKRA